MIEGETRHPQFASDQSALPQAALNGRIQRPVRFRDYSVSDVARFAKAWYLASKVDASIDAALFNRIIERHRNEDYDSFKYFDKRTWLRSKVMRLIELGLDRRNGLSVLDLGCGPGYFLYACKYFGHLVHGIDLPGREFYSDMIALFGIAHTSFKIEPYKPLAKLGRRFDVVTAHQICFNGHKTAALWGPREWSFFIDDLRTNHLTDVGAIALEFNEEPLIGFYTEQMRQFFSRLGGHMFRGRVLLYAAGGPSSSGW